MTGSKRERDNARAKYERQQAKKAAEDAARRRRNTIVATVVGLAVVAAGSVWLVKSNATDAPVSASVTPSSTPTTQPSTSPTSGKATPTTNAVACPQPSSAAPATKTFPNGPDIANIKFVQGHTYGLAINTNCGPIKMMLETDKAPTLSKSLIFLANTGATLCLPIGAKCDGANPNGKITKVAGYFDNTKCHRLTTGGIYILQCGDPKGNGSGGPGFTLPGENFPAAGANNYPRGTVAMANPNNKNANGSQFFLVYKDTTLSPDYSIVGHITEGLDVLDKIALAGTKNGSADGAPKQTVVISKVDSFETYAAASPTG